MAKIPVGEVYAKVIRDVCDHSRVDFEEGGVDITTLELLQSEWQRKLSQLHVTELPWDPKPTPAIKESASGNTKPALQTLPSNGNPNVGNPHSLNTLPPIKSEPASYPPHPPPQNYAAPSFPHGQPMTAQQRAAQNLHNVYGDRAGAQIATLQQGGQRQGPMPPQNGQPGTYIKQEDTSSDASRSTQPPPSVPIKSDQTDGAGDAFDTWKSEYARRKAEFAESRGRNDRLIKDHVLASQQQLEGGGVMRPLDQHIHMASSSTRRVPREGGTSSLHRAQGDAAGDDNDDEDPEEDEDAINSELDDPDELDDGIEDDDSTDQVMLCTYDKVQRVKNKWKCTLKDGILRVDGSEILFHKGNGEFEW